MDNIAYVALSRQTTLRREMDVIANNIANADTTGFKVEELLVQTQPAAPAANVDAPNPVNFVQAARTVRDDSQGALQQTGSAFDMAVDGEGHFMVEIGVRQWAFTRDGAFTMDGQGFLVTAAGQKVMGENFEPIQMNLNGGPPVVAADGTVSQGGAALGKIGVFRFPFTPTLEPIGGNLFRHPPNQVPVQVESARVRQGMLESSNVEPITQITRMIEVQRAYERVTRIVDSTEDLSRRAVERLGAVRG